MKIWHATSAEHSAALTIVGTFHREEDAQAAETLLKEMIQTATEAAGEVSRLEDLEFEAELAAGGAKELAARLAAQNPGKFPDDFPETFAAKFASKTPPDLHGPTSASVRTQKWLEAIQAHKVNEVNERDFYDLCGAETSVERAVGNRLEIRTDEWNFQGLISVLLARGASVEIQR